MTLAALDMTSATPQVQLNVLDQGRDPTHWHIVESFERLDEGFPLSYHEDPEAARYQLIDYIGQLECHEDATPESQTKWRADYDLSDRDDFSLIRTGGARCESWVCSKAAEADE